MPGAAPPETHKIVFLDRDAFKVEFHSPGFPHEWRTYPRTNPDQVIARIRDASIVITDGVPITAASIDTAPHLRLIAVAATGYNHIDLEACRRRGIVVCNVRDWSISVPEHVFALILALRRQSAEYATAIRAGAWQRSPSYALVLEPIPRALAGSTLGLIGHGALGRRVEAIAQGFGMDIMIAERMGVTPRVGRVALGEVIRQSDVLVVMCPLTYETRGMIGAKELATMKPDALLINCARGGIVDEPALVNALQRGVIGGAGVDVLTEEPPVNGNVLLDADLPNLIVTPHVAWVSQESQQILAHQLIDNLEAWHTGVPRNVVS
ncbi:MAG: D-2-hydroxyacid dehydrogenase [Thermomicrobiales bacterium]